MAHPPNTTAQEDLHEFFVYLQQQWETKERRLRLWEENLKEREEKVSEREAALTGNST